MPDFSTNRNTTEQIADLSPRAALSTLVLLQVEVFNPKIRTAGLCTAIKNHAKVLGTFKESDLMSFLHSKIRSRFRFATNHLSRGQVF